MNYNILFVSLIVILCGFHCQDAVGNIMHDLGISKIVAKQASTAPPSTTTSTTTTTSGKPKVHSHKHNFWLNEGDSIHADVKKYKPRCEDFAQAGNHNGFHQLGCCLLFESEPKFPKDDRALRNHWLHQCIMRYELLLNSEVNKKN